MRHLSFQNIGVTSVKGGAKRRRRRRKKNKKRGRGKNGVNN